MLQASSISGHVHCEFCTALATNHVVRIARGNTIEIPLQTHPKHTPTQKLIGTLWKSIYNAFSAKSGCNANQKYFRPHKFQWRDYSRSRLNMNAEREKYLHQYNQHGMKSIMNLFDILLSISSRIQWIILRYRLRPFVLKQFSRLALFHLYCFRWIQYAEWTPSADIHRHSRSIRP